MESNEDVARLTAAIDDSELSEQIQNSTNNVANSTNNNSIGKGKFDKVARRVNDISTQLDLTGQYGLSPNVFHKSNSITHMKLSHFDSMNSPFERSIYLNNRNRFFRCSSCNLESAVQNPWFPLVYRQLDSDGSSGNDIQYALFRPLTSNFTTDDLDLLTLHISSKCDCQDLSSTCFEHADLSPISEPLASTYNKKNSITHPLTLVNCKKPSKSGKKVVCYSITRLLNFNTEYQVYQCIDRDNMDSFALKLITKDERGHQLVDMYERLYEAPHPNLPSVVHILDDVDLYYIMIDNIRGPLLSELVSSHLPGSLPKEDVKRIIREILQALKHLHNQNISLNNLSLDNVAFKQPLEIGCDFDPCLSPRFSLLSLPSFRQIPSITITNIDLYTLHEHSKGTCCTNGIPQSLVDNDLWCVGFIMYCLYQGIPGTKTRESFNPFIGPNNDNWDDLDQELDLCKRLLAIDPLRKVTSVKEALIHPLFHI